jgi:hypothetical protein
MSSAEFAEWLAFMELEPFGPGRDELRAGVIAAVIANVNRDSKRSSEPFVPADFFPNLREPGPLEPADSLPTPQTLEQKLLAWAAVQQAAQAPRRSFLTPKVR